MNQDTAQGGARRPVLDEQGQTRPPLFAGTKRG